MGGSAYRAAPGLAVLEQAGRVILVGPHGGRHRVAAGDRSILVCVDGSRAAEQILPLARAWAEDQAMPLRFVRVVPPATPYPIDPSGGRRPAVDLPLRSRQHLW